MRGHSGGVELFRVAGVVAALALGTTGSVRGADSNVRLWGGPGMAVRRALEGASLRLEEPECRRVFSDFADPSGQPLEAALTESGETPEGYVQGLLFQDGSSQARCASGEILGGTRPGSRIVYVCPGPFFQWDKRDRLITELFIIHEALHSLGLGENPPTSAEINARVRKRCHDRAAVGSAKPRMPLTAR